MQRRQPKAYGLYSKLRDWLREDGRPGFRYTPADIAKLTGIDGRVIVGWIERGLLRASRTTTGRWRIRRRAIRRLFADHPEAWKVAIKGQIKLIREYRKRNGLTRIEPTVMKARRKKGESGE